MITPTFEWDPKKAARNLRKHDVSFEEALTVFQDPLAKVHTDIDHSACELREIMIGHSVGGRLLLVAFIDHQSRIRVISAREATRHERHLYEENT